MVGTGAGAHLGSHLRTRGTVAWGIGLAATGIAVQAGFAQGRSYLPTGIGLGLLGLGLGIAMPAATESIMGSLPRAKAGVGSAVNDTARELGGAIGVAVIGSILASSYSGAVAPTLDGLTGLPDGARAAAGDNIGAALSTAGSLGSAGDGLAAAARSAFVDGMQTGLWVAAAFTLLGMIAALVMLPRQDSGTTTEDPVLEAEPALAPAPHLGSPRPPVPALAGVEGVR
jgi:hypothetical protein